MKILSKEMLSKMGVQKVIFNDKATIVYLTNGNKGVAHCGEQDFFDPMVGFSVAYTIAKGTDGNKKQFKENLAYLFKKKKYTAEAVVAKSTIGAFTTALDLVGFHKLFDSDNIGFCVSDINTRPSR